MNSNHVIILYVENDPNDVILLKIAFERSGVLADLVAVPDGEQAEAYLQGSGIYADRGHYPWPDLVLMDLKMPRKSGLEVTRWIRAQSAFDSLPIVILTSSEQPEDRAAATRSGADGFFIKPVGLEELEEMVREISHKWPRLVAHNHHH